MKKFYCVLLIILIQLGCPPLRAESPTIHPFKTGSFTAIKNQHSNTPFILIFWSESCAYCMKELKLFGSLHKQFPDIKIITVATDPFLDEKKVTHVLSLSGLNLEHTWVFAEQFPERIYFDVNKRWRGELPLTYFYDRNQHETRKVGIIDKKELLEWLTNQSAHE